MKIKSLVLAAIPVLAALALLLFVWQRLPRQDPAIQSEMANIVGDYRRIIVLMDGADDLDLATRTRSVAAGRVLFYKKTRALQDLTQKMLEPLGRPGRIGQLVRYLNEDRTLHDADKLAFLDLVDELATAAPGDSLRALLDNLQSIQLAYREEVTRIFSQ